MLTALPACLLSLESAICEIVFPVPVLLLYVFWPPTKAFMCRDVIQCRPKRKRIVIIHNGPMATLVRLQPQDGRGAEALHGEFSL